MENTRISVVIPAYNGEKFISKAIESVLRQTVQDFEIIVVDDCSKDRTADTVREYAKKDKRVKLFVLEKNSGGPAKPTNVGIEQSQGEYVSYLDQDDIYLPDSFEKRLKILEKGGVDVLIANMWVVDLESGRFIDYLDSNVSSFMISRKMFDLNEIGLLSEEASGIDEYEWLMRYRLKKGTAGIKYFSEPAVLYMRHEGQISEADYSEKSVNAFLRRDFVVLKIAETGGPDFKDDLSWIYFWIGYRYGLLGNFKSSREYLKKSLENGSKPPAKIFLIMSILGSKSLYLLLAKLIKFIKKKIIKKMRLEKMIKMYPAAYKNALEFYKNIAQ